MAEKIQYGRCVNTANCSLAFNHERIFVPRNGCCPECGQKLQTGFLGRLLLTLCWIALVAGLLGAGVYYAKKNLVHAPPAATLANGAKTSRPQSMSPEHPPADGGRTEPKIADSNMPPANTTSPSGTPEFSTPPSSESGYAPDRPQFGDESDPSFKARRDALSRIALMSHLSEDQKAKLVTSVDRARALGCIFIVPLNGGRQALTTRESDVLVKGFQAPNIRKLMEDPTLVFVVLGYTNEGNPPLDEKVSLECAQSVASTLRSRAGVQNVLYTTGMGEAKPIAQNLTPSNREVEIWAFYP